MPFRQCVSAGALWRSEDLALSVSHFTDREGGGSPWHLMLTGKVTLGSQVCNVHLLGAGAGGNTRTATVRCAVMGRVGSAPGGGQERPWPAFLVKLGEASRRRWRWSWPWMGSRKGQARASNGVPEYTTHKNGKTCKGVVAKPTPSPCPPSSAWEAVSSGSLCLLFPWCFFRR